MGNFITQPIFFTDQLTNSSLLGEALVSGRLAGQTEAALNAVDMAQSVVGEVDSTLAEILQAFRETEDPRLKRHYLEVAASYLTQNHHKFLKTLDYLRHRYARKSLFEDRGTFLATVASVSKNPGDVSSLTMQAGTRRMKGKLEATAGNKSMQTASKVEDKRDLAQREGEFEAEIRRLDMEAKADNPGLVDELLQTLDKLEKNPKEATPRELAQVQYLYGQSRYANNYRTLKMPSPRFDHGFHSELMGLWNKTYQVFAAVKKSHPTPKMKKLAEELITNWAQNALRFFF